MSDLPVTPSDIEPVMPPPEDWLDAPPELLPPEVPAT